MTVLKKYFIFFLLIGIIIARSSVYVKLHNKNEPSTKNALNIEHNQEKTLPAPKEINRSSQQNQSTAHVAINSYNEEKITEWTSKIKQWINDFPFPQETTRAIISANPPDVQEALNKFNQRLLNEIINNSTLSNEEKSYILWDIYINTAWLGKENALQAIVQDHLTSNAPFQIVDDIRSTYQTWSSSGSNPEKRHDLLELVDGILNVDSSAFNTQVKQQYSENLISAKALLLDQIRTNVDSDETQSLTSFAIDLYASHANNDELEELVSVIQSMSSSNPKSALQLYHSTWKNVLSQPDKAIQATNLMLSSPSQDLNRSLVFLLKEDGNILISEIPITARNTLLIYLQSLESSARGTDMESDIKLSIERLQNTK